MSRLEYRLWIISFSIALIAFGVAMLGPLNPTMAENPDQLNPPDYFELDAEGRFIVVPLLIEYTVINSRYLFVFMDTQTLQFELAQSNNAGRVHAPADVSAKLPDTFNAWMIQVDPRVTGTAGFCYFAYVINSEGTVWMSASCDQ